MRAVTTWRARARRLAPFAVSLGILAFLLARLDLRGVAAALDARAAVSVTLALLGYGAASLLLEAVSLVRVTPGAGLGLVTAARLKAASYLLAVVHYTVGAGALALLLRRRAGIEIGVAAGIVLLISAIDLAVLIALCGGGAAVLGTEAPTVRTSVVGVAAVGLVGGFALLRAPRSLGPLERLRALPVFAAAAQTPAARLAELVGCRVAFVCTFLAVVTAALWAFGIRVPPGDLLIGVGVCALVGALPIAVAGLGTSQAAFLVVFRQYAPPETLLACSLALSVGMVLMRGALGAVFAREYAREAARLADAGAGKP